MATPDDYAAVETALTKKLNEDIQHKVPSWAQHMIPAGLVPQLAAEAAKVAVDALDAHRVVPST